MLGLAMNGTPFPLKPGDVAALTATEFAFSLQRHDAPSFDDICQRFQKDVNRALIWWIRFHALQTWYARDGIVQWLSGAGRMAHICEVAASFRLNDEWEFDADEFCVAVDMTATRASEGNRR